MSIPLMRVAYEDPGSTAHRQRWRNHRSRRDSVSSHGSYDRVPGQNSPLTREPPVTTMRMITGLED